MSSDGMHRKKAEEAAAKNMIAQAIMKSLLSSTDEMPCCSITKQVITEIADSVLGQQDKLLRNMLTARELLPEGTCLDANAQWVMIYHFETTLGLIEMALRVDEVPVDEVMDVFRARFENMPAEWPDVPEERILAIRRRYDEVLAMYTERNAAIVDRTDQAKDEARARRDVTRESERVDLDDDAKAKLEALRERIAQTRAKDD